MEKCPAVDEETTRAMHAGIAAKSPTAAADKRMGKGFGGGHPGKVGPPLEVNRGASCGWQVTLPGKRPASRAVAEGCPNRQGDGRCIPSTRQVEELSDWPPDSLLTSV